VCPNCSPTRVELLTGKYGFRNYSGWGSLDPAQKTIANMLHDAGYKTCVAGKWQLGGGDAFHSWFRIRPIQGV
jgi:arylsulfatase A